MPKKFLNTFLKEFPKSSPKKFSQKFRRNFSFFFGNFFRNSYKYSFGNFFSTFFSIALKMLRNFSRNSSHNCFEVSLTFFLEISLGISQIISFECQAVAQQSKNLFEIDFRHKNKVSRIRKNHSGSKMVLNRKIIIFFFNSKPSYPQLSNSLKGMPGINSQIN